MIDDDSVNNNCLSVKRGPTNMHDSTGPISNERPVLTILEKLKRILTNCDHSKARYLPIVILRID
jgi:hypothetical protein